MHNCLLLFALVLSFVSVSDPTHLVHVVEDVNMDATYVQEPGYVRQENGTKHDTTSTVNHAGHPLCFPALLSSLIDALQPYSPRLYHPPVPT